MKTLTSDKISFVFFLLIILLNNPIKAQIIIRSNEYNTTFGIKHIMYEADENTGIGYSVDVGQSGGPHHWEYTAEQFPNGDTSEYTVVDPQLTPLSMEFPDADHAWYMNDVEDTVKTWIYFDLSLTKLSQLGMAFVKNNDSLVQKIIPEDIITKFPATLNTSWTNNYATHDGTPGVYEYIDSTSSEAIIDAWGTITVPSGTYDCLRIYRQETDFFLTYVSGQLVSADTSTYIDYDWIAKDVGLLAGIASIGGVIDPHFTQAGYITLRVNKSNTITDYKEFFYDDTVRSYVVYEPELDPNPQGYPLVIGLHGTGSDAYGMLGTASLISKANQEQFIVACPNGLKYNLYTYFNAGGGYEELTNGTDDLGFISAVIDTMIKNYNVDTTRIYVIGHSNGGMMAYRVAAELSNRVAAIGSNAGQMTLEECNPDFPVPVIHFHGLSDPIAPYEGTGDSILIVPPVDSVIATWRGINKCGPIAEEIYNGPGIIGKKWTSLVGRGDVELYTIEDMPHKWSRDSTYGIQTTDVMWDFLKLQQKGIGSIVEEKFLVHDDTTRSYLVYAPELDPDPDGYPLVVGFHGAGTFYKGFSFLGTAGLIPKAIKEKFIVACPNSLTFGIPFWNAGSGYEQICNGTDDVGFISEMIDSMIKNYNIDTTRIYLMGHSNGSAMAYRVAAELSERIAGLAVNSGQMVYEFFNPESSVPILHFHGLEDDKFSYYGASDEDSLLVIPPVDTVMEMWREANNCSSIPDTIYNENGILGRRWNSMLGNGDVILYRIEDWGHSWPRSSEPGIDATEVMWDFLEDQQKGGAANIEAKQFVFKGEARTYLVYDPSPNSGTRPLVIGLHCHTGTAAGFLSYTDWIQKAKDENFIGVFPNGLHHPIGTAWNAGNSFEWMTQGTDDVGFISTLIDTMIKNYDIDTTRIYATGHSNGSMMSYRLAADLSDRIAAIGCVSAPMVYEYCDPEYSVPIIHFHGLSDTTCPYEGIVKDYITIPPVDSSTAIWIKANNCVSIPDTFHNENGIMGRKWASPDGKGDIVLYTIETCMHDWPVSDKYGISATDEIWNFFKLHTRNIVSSIEKDNYTKPESFALFQNYPNPFNPKTMINYQLPMLSKVELAIYNILGQKVVTLVNKKQDAGQYTVEWDASAFASGIYLYRLNTESFTKTKKLILLK